ncbi:MAG TPA: N-acetyltransferase family protein [Actinotalea sp.]|nr:N-acetyltransferase family protein [Actinotalea sp.]
MIRDATTHDLSAIHAIHNHAVATSLAIWTDVPERLDDRQAWFDAHREAGHAVLVAEQGGEVVGYASLSQYRPKPGYRWTVEDSVYVADGHQGRGHGRALLAALVERARTDGFHAVVGVIEAGNAASIALHASLGFQDAGVLREVGRKFDRWLDLQHMVLLLDPPGAAARGR